MVSSPASLMPFKKRYPAGRRIRRVMTADIHQFQGNDCGIKGSG
jgi:hypothetical protein